MQFLSKYVTRFSRLRVDRSKGEPAPHKPVLLLSVIEGITKGEITENKIHITPELVAQFKDYWHQLVNSQKFIPNFSLPFYHLKSDGFWNLQTAFGKEIILNGSYSIKSFVQLKDAIDYAYFDESLFELLINEHSRSILRRTLLDTYFQSQHTEASSIGIVEQIINQILNEPSAKYASLIDSSDEEEIFIRGGIFKKEVPRIYNYTCCISGMRIIADKDVQMIDACHIIPFSISHDDTISNGLSLCPNLHRAFDRGLIAIDDDYKVRLKPFSEIESCYSIKKFEGKKILLPQKSEYLPSLINLAKHRNKFDF